MSIYDRPTWQLMWQMVENLGMRPGQVISKPRVFEWFGGRYPKIKQSTLSAHLIKMSTNAPSRIHYSARPGSDDLFFQVDGSHFRLYDKNTDPPPIYEGSANQSTILYASFNLIGKRLDPHKISASLNLTPSTSFQRRDPRSGGGLWPHGFWSFETKDRLMSDDLVEHIEWLLAHLEPVRDELLACLRDDQLKATMSCFWINHDHIEFDLSPALLARIAALGCTLNLDIYTD